jgi:hypothetical protein
MPAVPQPHADTLVAPFGHDDVEADETKAAAVRYGADAADGTSIDFGDEKTVGVRLCEAVRVV